MNKRKLFHAVDYDSHVTFTCTHDLRQKLIAFSYFRGDSGAYAGLLRNFVSKIVEREIAEMDPQERKEYQTILESVRTNELTSRMLTVEREYRKRQAEKDNPDSTIADQPEA